MQSLLYLALSNAIVATLLAAFVAVVTRFCRRPSVRHALWLLVLLKLVTPPLIPLSVTWPQSEEGDLTSTEPSTSALVAPLVMEPSELIPSRPEATLPIEAATVRKPEEVQAPRSLTVAAPFFPLALLVVWLGGAGAWWIVAAVRLRIFRRLFRQAPPATPEMQEQGRRLAALLGLRRCPPIVFVSAPLSPMLWALGFSPRLLLPANLWSKLTAEQQDTLLAHELAHLRRGDHWVRRLELLVLGLYWWHPVVWWARRRLQEAEEECCDALVVACLPDAAPAYASALVETVAFLSQTRPAALVGVSGAGQVPLLKRRLTMILLETSSRKPSRIGFWIVLGMGVLLLPLAPRAARTEALEEPAAEQTKEQLFSLDFGFPLADRHTKPHAEAVGNCVACHSVPVNGDFHGKQQSWREAHDEIVRLMDELRRRQTEFGAATKSLPAAAEPDRSVEIEILQDAIELLKVQVRLKEARVSGTKAILEEYQKRLKNYDGVNRSTPGAIPRDSMQQVQLEITTHKAQLQVSEVELQEARLRLKQAERGLTRLQPPLPRAAPTKPHSPERLQELEKKFDELRKEIDNLRREMRPKESRDPDQEYRELCGFIIFVLPTLNTTRLEENIPKAQKAFQMCKQAGDHTSLRKLRTGINGHVERIDKELAKLHPELVIEDEKEAIKLKKVRDQITKIGQDILSYLAPDLRGR